MRAKRYADAKKAYQAALVEHRAHDGALVDRDGHPYLGGHPAARDREAMRRRQVLERAGRRGRLGSGPPVHPERSGAFAFDEHHRPATLDLRRRLGEGLAERPDTVIDDRLAID